MSLLMRSLRGSPEQGQVWDGGAVSADGHQALCAHTCSDACTRVCLHAHVHSKYLKVWLGQCPFPGCDLEKLRAPKIMGTCSGIPQEQPHKFPCALKKM